MGIRITTWNVNGIRNPFQYQPWRDKRTFNAMFDLLEADIVVLQETKIQRKDLKDDMVLVPGWDCYFSLPRHEKGKFGVVIYTRQSVCAPIRAEEGLSGILCPPNSTIPFCEQPENERIGGYPTLEQARTAPNATDLSEDFASLDCEGRCVVLEFPAFVLIGLYCPASRDESRNSFRYAFHNLLDIRIRNLTALGKRVIVTGDLNIIRNEMDMANAEADLRKQDTTVDEYFAMPSRKMLNQWLDDGIKYDEPDLGREEPVLHDICRTFQPNRKGMFTCWETKINARPGNYGARIDYVLCSLAMKGWFSDANIQEGLMGSDHCPVYAILKDRIEIDGREVHTIDMLNPLDMFREGQRIREYSVKDMLPLSGKLIPEFNGRRNIRDMFSKKPSLPKIPTNGIPAQIEQSQETVSTQDTTTTSSTISALVHSQEENIPASIPAASTNKKRSAPSKSNPPLSKRSKSSSTTEMKPTANGQKSLKSFFQKPDQSTKAPSPSQPTALAASSLPRSTTPPPAPQVKTPTPSPILPTSTQTSPLSTAANRSSWSTLFSKPIAPLCEGHNEPCKTMLTKKPGPNCGRSFWMCAKPLGPSGAKEKGTEWRCGTFIWASDWNARGDGGGGEKKEKREDE